ncbi:hypothetical protein ACIQOW_00245 [Kitasatospora sp. NPDC091335]|uniref:hypothetical protein n=1 Tax=Kitasatospora sp. NPDC091335 TaxID=3364085 RepID=UPI003806C73B
MYGQGQQYPQGQAAAARGPATALRPAAAALRGAPAAVRPTPVRPAAASSGRLSCGVYSLLSGKTQSTVCVWADKSTYARVTFTKVSVTAGGVGGSALTPAQAAEKTRAIRDTTKTAK